MSNLKSLKERLNSVKNKGPERWLSRDLFEAPAEQQAFDDSVKMGASPDIKRELQAQPGKAPPRGFNPFQARKSPDPVRKQQALGSLASDSHIRNGFAKRNEELDWDKVDVDDKKIEDWGIHALLDAQDYAEDQKPLPKAQGAFSPLAKQESGLGERRLNWHEVQNLHRRRDRNLGLFGDVTKEDLKTLDPERRKSLLEKTAKLVKSSRPFKFTPGFVESTFQILKKALDTSKVFKPSGSRGKAQGEGMAQEGKVGRVRDAFFYQKEGDLFPTYHPPDMDAKKADGSFKYRNKNGKINTAGNNIQKEYETYMKDLANDSIGEMIRNGGTNQGRSKLAWQLFLEQGGTDAYSGMPLDPRNMQMEHVAPYGSAIEKTTLPVEEAERIAQEVGEAGGDEEEYARRVEARRQELIDEAIYGTENINNFVLLNSSMNAAKADGTMQEMYERSVDPYVDTKEEDYAGAEEDLDTLKGKGGSYNNSSLMVERRDGFINEALGSFLAPTTYVDGNGTDQWGANFRGQEQAKDFYDELKRVQGEMDRVRDEVVGRGRKKPTKASFGTGSRHDGAAYQKALDEFDEEEAALRKKLYSTQAPNIINRFNKDVLKILGLNSTFRYQTGGQGFDSGTLDGLMNQMVNDEEIEGRNDSYRDMWNHASRRAQKLAEHFDTIEGQGKTSSHLLRPEKFMQLLMDQSQFNPDSYDFADDDEDFSAASVLK